MYRRGTKRVADVMLTSLALPFCRPFFWWSRWLRFKLRTPVLFRQERPGLHGRPFTILKFRTMTDLRDSSGALLPDGAGRAARTSAVPPVGSLRRISTATSRQACSCLLEEAFHSRA
jgi:lipopolysaccharide/colanic/teichoic acid biosynthesis glycosyltransferase